MRERTLPLSTRYTFRYELQLLLERVGFQVVDIFRDYDKNPYDGTGEIIAVARRSCVTESVLTQHQISVNMTSIIVLLLSFV